MRVSHAIDHIDVTFDDETLVADAGLIVPATLMVPPRSGGADRLDGAARRPGRRRPAGAQGAHVGGGDPGRRQPHRSRRPAAGGGDAGGVAVRGDGPSTLGTFLRAFTFGHVRQLDAVIGEAIRRAWALGAGPGAAAMTMDLDSTICEVHGKAKQGAAYGYTKVLGYHPLLATRADTGEVLHARLRKGILPAGRHPVRRRARRPGPPGGGHAAR